MRYADQHMHCTCSPDAAGSLADMAAAAARAGLRHITFTDHLDMAEESSGRTAAAPLARRAGAFCRRREEYKHLAVPGLEISLGIELGEIAQNPEEARAAAAADGLDLVIGSVHNLPDLPDFYFYPYADEAECRRLNHLYLQELCRTAELDAFDVMGHIGYTSRYMSRRGFRERITLEEYGDELRTLFETLIRRGKGIECNASGFRSVGAPFPDRPLLKLYRALGGEIITVGGDCHDPGPVGRYIPETYALLADCGFRAVCEFRRRQPTFVSLG